MLLLLFICSSLQRESFNQLSFARSIHELCISISIFHIKLRGSLSRLWSADLLECVKFKIRLSIPGLLPPLIYYKWIKLSVLFNDCYFCSLVGAHIKILYWQLVQHGIHLHNRRQSFSLCLAFIFRNQFFLSQKHELLHMKDMHFESVNAFLQNKNGMLKYSWLFAHDKVLSSLCNICPLLPCSSLFK